MNSEVLNVALLWAGLVLYVGSGVVFGLLAASGASLDLIDTVSSLASAYACARVAATLRAPVDTALAEAHA